MLINKIFYLPLFIILLILTLAATNPARAADEEKNYIATAKGKAAKPKLVKGAKAPVKIDPALSQDLVYRVAFSRVDDVKTLLDKGADPEAKNIAGVPVLLIAVVRKDDEAPGIVEALLKAGANVNAVNKNGKLAVVEATKNGRADILQILIDHHAVLGIAQDLEGHDLLTIAESRGNLDIVKIINAGIDSEKDKLEDLKSEENFINLIQQYAYLSCANEYLNFYIANQTKGVNMVAFNNVITSNAAEMESTSQKVKMLFKMDDYELKNMQDMSRKQIITQMNYYQTNENRELNGIGTDADLNDRCWKIAKKWNSSKLNLDQYRANTK